jgi:hypothetical protein
MISKATSRHLLKVELANIPERSGADEPHRRSSRS